MFTNIITEYNLKLYKYDSEIHSEINFWKKINNINLISRSIFYKTNRLLLSFENDFENDNNNLNNLLVIMDKPSIDTDKFINNNKNKNIKLPLIIKLLLKIKKNNNFNNIFLMNLTTDDNNINIKLFKQIFNTYPDINILIASGDNTYSNNIINDIKNIISSNNLIKCFKITKNNNPYNLIQRINQDLISDIIDNKRFIDYKSYDL